MVNFLIPHMVCLQELFGVVTPQSTVLIHHMMKIEFHPLLNPPQVFPAVIVLTLIDPSGL